MLRHIERYGTIQALDKCGHPTKLGAIVLQTIDDMMQRDDETIARELVVTLRANGISLSTTAWKGWRLLGWTRWGTAYCQLYSLCTKIMQKDWNGCIKTLGTLENVIWTDVVSCPDVMRSRARITSGNIGPKVGAGSVLSSECGTLQWDRYLVN